MTRAEHRRLRRIAVAFMVAFPPSIASFALFRWIFGFWPWSPAWGESFEA